MWLKVRLGGLYTAAEGQEMSDVFVSSKGAWSKADELCLLNILYAFRVSSLFQYHRDRKMPIPCAHWSSVAQIGQPAWNLWRQTCEFLEQVWSFMLRTERSWYGRVRAEDGLHTSVLNKFVRDASPKAKGCVSSAVNMQESGFLARWRVNFKGIKGKVLYRHCCNYWSCCMEIQD
jgi:hypothetical protein